MVSISVSKDVIVVGEKYPTVRVKVTFNDPDGVVWRVKFKHSKLADHDYAYTPVKVEGTKRTYAYSYKETTGWEVGRRRVTTTAETAGGTAAATTSITYIAKHKPLLSLYPNSSMSTMWGKKGGFYGYLSRTSANAGRKIHVQFKPAGTKKWNTRFTVETAFDGRYRTKLFKIDDRGKWRAKFNGVKYVLAAKSASVAAGPS